MPITQSRFMAVLTASAEIIEDRKNIDKTINKNLEELISRANSVMERTEDKFAREAIDMLLDQIKQAREACRLTADFSDFCALVNTEKKHFDKNARKNDNIRRNLEHSRRMQGLPQRAKTIETPLPYIPSPPMTEHTLVERMMADPKVQKGIEELRRKYWPEVCQDNGNSPAQRGAEKQNTKQQAFGKSETQNQGYVSPETNPAAGGGGESFAQQQSQENNASEELIDPVFAATSGEAARKQFTPPANSQATTSERSERTTANNLRSEQASSQGQSHGTIPQEHKDGTIRHLPPAEELYAKPNLTDTLL